LPDDEFDTVGGLVINAFGRLPSLKEKVTIDRFTFTVTGGDKRKITQLDVSKVSS
jgi:magnesium and cobalt transporter